MTWLIFTEAFSTSSGLPETFSCVPLESILSAGNLFLRISNLLLFTPTNSMGLIVSRLMIISVKSCRFFEMEDVLLLANILDFNYKNTSDKIVYFCCANYRFAYVFSE